MCCSPAMTGTAYPIHAVSPVAATPWIVDASVPLTGRSTIFAFVVCGLSCAVARTAANTSAISPAFPITASLVHELHHVLVRLLRIHDGQLLDDAPLHLRIGLLARQRDELVVA